MDNSIVVLGPLQLLHVLAQIDDSLLLLVDVMLLDLRVDLPIRQSIPLGGMQFMVLDVIIQIDRCNVKSHAFQQSSVKLLDLQRL